MNIGKKVMVHGYKKNGWLYRVWEFPIIIDQTDDYLCLAKKNTVVITSEKNSKRNFKSKSEKDAFWFFPKDKWFNILVTVNTDKSLSFYINIASPYIFEEEAVKYIDFDLDIKIYPTKEYKLLDENEFLLHKEEFKYGNKLSRIIEEQAAMLNNRETVDKILDKLTPEFINEMKKKYDEIVGKINNERRSK